MSNSKAAPTAIPSRLNALVQVKWDKHSMKLEFWSRCVQLSNHPIERRTRLINRNHISLSNLCIESTHLAGRDVGREILQGGFESCHLNSERTECWYARENRKRARHKVRADELETFGKVVDTTRRSHTGSDCTNSRVNVHQYNQRPANSDLALNKVCRITGSLSPSILREWEKHCKERHDRCGPPSQGGYCRPIQLTARPRDTRDHYAHCKHLSSLSVEHRHSATPLEDGMQADA